MTISATNTENVAISTTSSEDVTISTKTTEDVAISTTTTEDMAIRTTSEKGAENTSSAQGEEEAEGGKQEPIGNNILTGEEFAFEEGEEGELSTCTGEDKHAYLIL